MPDPPIWDDDPDLRVQAEAERSRYRQSPKPNGHDVSGVSLDDFYAFMPTHNYIFAPARAHWPAASVNARIPPVPLLDENGKPVLNEDGKPVKLRASRWLDCHRPVEQITWAPGLPMIVRDRLAFEGGWIERRGVACFNLYLPATITPGDPKEAEKWVKHVRFVYPDDADHILDFLAHRVQRPAEKINHALVLGGEYGIGKDTLLEPVKHAVGPWNFKEASPQQVLGRFNSFTKSVILRINEAHDLGEFDRYEFYEHMKSLTAAPPDVLLCDEKNVREHYVVNVCGVIITTNHKTDGLFLPAEDRRHFVAWSDLTKEDEAFQNGYWKDLWGFYAAGGVKHVTAFLGERDISKFDSKAPPPKTAAFWTIADAHRPAEEADIADLLDLMGKPEAFTLAMLIRTAEDQPQADGAFNDWLKARKNRRIIPHRLEKCGYVPVRNPTAEDGLWRIKNKRQAAYAKSSLTLSSQIKAAQNLR